MRVMFTRFLFRCTNHLNVNSPVRFVYSRRHNKLKYGYEFRFYKSKELEAARKIMVAQKTYALRLPKDQDVASKCEVITESLSVRQIIKDFKEVIAKYNVPTTNIAGELDQIVNEMASMCNQLDEGELIEVLESFSAIDLPQEHVASFISLRDALSSAFAAKLSDWSVNQILSTCDIWHDIQNGNRTEFASVACDALARYVDTMTAQQIVQSLLNFGWRKFPSTNMDEFEEKLKGYTNGLSLNELGIAAIGFFRTNSHIRSTALVQNIYERMLAEDLLKIDSVMLTLLLKV